MGDAGEPPLSAFVSATTQSLELQQTLDLELDGDASVVAADSAAALTASSTSAISRRGSLDITRTVSFTDGTMG